MATQLFSNNATSTLASGITSTATSITLSSGSGVLFPSPTGGNYYLATLTDVATGLVREIVKVTAMSGDVATVVRAQESTTARAYLTGDYFALLITAGTMGNFVQTGGIANNSISNAQLAQAPLYSFKGNNTGATANVTDLTVTQAISLLGFSGNLSSTGTIILPFNGTNSLYVNYGGGTTSTSGDVAVSFNTTFPTACVALTTGLNNTGNVTLWYNSLTRSGFNAGADNAFNATRVVTAFTYIAIGY